MAVTITTTTIYPIHMHVKDGGGCLQIIAANKSISRPDGRRLALLLVIDYYVRPSVRRDASVRYGRLARCEHITHHFWGGE